MISICIPVYNNHVLALAKELSRQLESLNKGGEIIILDDGSSFFFKESNATLRDLSFVRYKELPSNIGRLAIRMLLAQEANYEWLLFLDNDVKIDNVHFVRRYYDAILGNQVYI